MYKFKYTLHVLFWKFRNKPNLESLRSTQPIDVAAHLALLGESLGIIGQRLKEHQVKFL